MCDVYTYSLFQLPALSWCDSSDFQSKMSKHSSSVGFIKPGFINTGFVVTQYIIVQ
jgi:hypothetical protein